MLTSRQQQVIEKLKGKKVGVLGLGRRSGVPLIRFLHGLGCQIVACDRKEKEQLKDVLAQLGDIPVELRLGEEYLAHLSDCQVLFRTPFMRPDLPELQAAVQRGACLSSEIELVFALASAPITGITGSDGKTTTTTLISEILKADGRQVYLGGNIGYSLIEEVLHIPTSAEIVLELSSFQLMTLTDSPQAAVITNLSPNHLDYHTSFDEYVHVKTNLIRAQGEDDITVLNWDNRLTKDLASLTQGKIYYFSRQEEVAAGAFVRDGHIILRAGQQEMVLCATDELKILGDHNVENMMAAAIVAYAKGAKLSAIRQVATTFAGVEHRLELVRELHGVRYYNDSIASSPTRTIAGLAALPYPVVLIAGGYDKKIPFEPLAKAVVGREDALALIGQTAPAIEQALKEELAAQGASLPMQQFDSLQDALLWAQQQARPGSAVVLSPACASFDMFADFEARGRAFKELVHQLN
ncbi:MAG: UDP-N-acetylmuramoyl-L-alanine--D-glutamate ligase [Firmicutes bacterium]|nr:UDP-N-acetylmuramoyl-L-alanine--D-glutamate ligase [Bacillota bacterium]